MRIQLRPWHTGRSAASLLWLAAVCIFGSACTFNRGPTKGWIGETISTSATQPSGGASGGGGRLDVIIPYDKLLAGHAALRLTGPGELGLLWDPGGYFGEHDPHYHRMHDLLLDPAPTVEDYWLGRWHSYGDSYMLAFEWDLSPAETLRLRTVLVDGMWHGDGPECYDPAAIGGACALTISDFLKHFASERTHIHEAWLWPGFMAEHLWADSPDRVYMFDANGPTVVYHRRASPPQR
jgi:hypothetical protein